ncbi:CLUMA_CG004187, isoform A [Clunio marinus]|uniref:CLUMA_CG004187, isoform A n=1 Tax=Clunio marinus TaxID=568069 RepID=A0A1J1HSG3_9DIPT|nr:CLUMA_CG004187, isoform A [Clunio marinus]
MLEMQLSTRNGVVVMDHVDWTALCTIHSMCVHYRGISWHCHLECQIPTIILTTRVRMNWRFVDCRTNPPGVK